jgi:hypothetical protein
MKTLVMAALILTLTGCAGLIHRPTDSTPQTVAKTSTRVVLVLPTFFFSEMFIMQAAMNEGLISRPARRSAAQRARSEQRASEDRYRRDAAKSERRYKKLLKQHRRAHRQNRN